MGNFIDLTGRRFGRLKVIERNGTRNRQSLWRCICDCGRETLSLSNSLRDGKSTSCGCKRLVHLVDAPPRKTHGGSQGHDRLYYVWCGMRQRCSYPKNNKYSNYGGRGITVCDEWKSNYASFRDWAMAAGYNSNAARGKCTIDQIDVNGSYSPDNCRWVDMATQATNKRKKVG